MTLYAFAGFTLAMLVLAASPGPGMAATMACAASSGFRAALAMIAGIVFGDVVFLLLAMTGLSMVARTLGELFTLVKICGGIYLVWLGIKIWKSDTVDASAAQISQRPHAARGFISGLLVTLSNPKVILFYCGFLPTFVDLSNLQVLDVVLVAAVICTVVSLVLGIYAFMAANARRYLTGTTAGLWVNRAAGTAMVAAGVTLLSWLRRS